VIVSKGLQRFHHDKPTIIIYTSTACLEHPSTSDIRNFIPLDIRNFHAATHSKAIYNILLFLFYTKLIQSINKLTMYVCVCACCLSVYAYVCRMVSNCQCYIMIDTEVSQLMLRESIMIAL